MNFADFAAAHDAHQKAKGRRESAEAWVAHCARAIVKPEPSAWDWEVLRCAIARLDATEAECESTLQAMREESER